MALNGFPVPDVRVSTFVHFYTTQKPRNSGPNTRTNAGRRPETGRQDRGCTNRVFLKTKGTLPGSPAQQIAKRKRTVVFFPPRLPIPSNRHWFMSNLFGQGKMFPSLSSLFSLFLWRGALLPSAFLALEVLQKVSVPNHRGTRRPWCRPQSRPQDPHKSQV